MCPLLSPDIWGDVSARTPDKQFLFLADPSKRSSYVPFGISMLINLLQTEGAELLIENTERERERETRGREKKEEQTDKLTGRDFIGKTCSSTTCNMRIIVGVWH